MPAKTSTKEVKKTLKTKGEKAGEGKFIGQWDVQQNALVKISLRLTLIFMFIYIHASRILVPIVSGVSTVSRPCRVTQLSTQHWLYSATKESFWDVSEHLRHTGAAGRCGTEPIGHSYVNLCPFGLNDKHDNLRHAKCCLTATDCDAFYAAGT